MQDARLQTAEDRGQITEDGRPSDASSFAKASAFGKPMADETEDRQAMEGRQGQN